MLQTSELSSRALMSEINSAIADLIMLGFSYDINIGLQSELLLPPPIRMNLEDLASYYSARKCLSNSVIAATRLIENKSDLFPTFFIIEADLRLSELSEVFKRGIWKSHAGLVLQDILGNWHFISPANGLIMLTHLQAKTLSELLTQVDHEETKIKNISIWPSEETIRQSIPTFKADSINIISRVFEKNKAAENQVWFYTLESIKEWLQQSMEERYSEAEST